MSTQEDIKNIIKPYLEKLQKIKQIVNTTNCEHSNYCSIAEEIRKVLQ